MKETLSMFETRWNAELKVLRKVVTGALSKSSDLSNLNLPRTESGLIDFRGYSAPKAYDTVGGTQVQNKYVSLSLEINKMTFDGVDFSFSDFENCVFTNCRFKNCRFDEAKLVSADFGGCEFDGISLVRANLEFAKFFVEDGFFKKRKDNFKNVFFEGVNLAETWFERQRMGDCEFNNCKTEKMSLSACHLDNIKFRGYVKNIHFNDSKATEVDLSESMLSGLSLEKQSLEGFRFPRGDVYFAFRNKSKELEGIKAPSNLTKQQQELFERIKYTWLVNDAEMDFVDINWLEDNEKEIGKLLITMLRNRRSGSR